jgi:hypothetical protein
MPLSPTASSRPSETTNATPELPDLSIISLRPPEDILVVAQSVDEAREHLGDLADRKIGGLCVKNCVHEDPEQIYRGAVLIRDFMEEVADATKTYSGSVELDIRRKPIESATDTKGSLTIFNEDTYMHFDGFYKTKVVDDKVAVTSEYRVLPPNEYMGVGHHITYRGVAAFIMERLTTIEATELAIRLLYAKNQENYFNTPDTRLPRQGETLLLEAGDYLALHQYPVMHKPMYIHGTAFSHNRESVVFGAHPPEEVVLGLNQPLQIIREPIDDEYREAPERIVLL